MMLVIKGVKSQALSVSLVTQRIRCKYARYSGLFNAIAISIAIVIVIVIIIILSLLSLLLLVFFYYLLLGSKIWVL